MVSYLIFFKKNIAINTKLKYVNIINYSNPLSIAKNL